MDLSRQLNPMDLSQPFSSERVQLYPKNKPFKKRLYPKNKPFKKRLYPKNKPAF